MRQWLKKNIKAPTQTSICHIFLSSKILLACISGHLSLLGSANLKFYSNELEGKVCRPIKVSGMYVQHCRILSLIGDGKWEKCAIFINVLERAYQKYFADNKYLLRSD